MSDDEISDLLNACREGWRYAAELEEERKRLQAELDRLLKSAAQDLAAERAWFAQVLSEWDRTADVDELLKIRLERLTPQAPPEPRQAE